MEHLQQLRSMVTVGEKKTCAVACAHDAHTLEAIITMRSEGLMDCLLVGHGADIRRIADEHGYTLSDGEIIEAATDEEAAAICVQLVREGKAGFILKGLLPTGTLLKAVVNKQTGLHTGSVISHFVLLELPGYHKLLGIADSGMIPDPDLETKKAIVRNSADVCAQNRRRCQGPLRRRGRCRPAGGPCLRPQPVAEGYCPVYPSAAGPGGLRPEPEGPV